MRGWLIAEQNSKYVVHLNLMSKLKNIVLFLLNRLKELFANILHFSESNLRVIDIFNNIYI